MLARIHGWATAAWLALLCGGGVGFVARDLLGLDRNAVAGAWVGGAALAILAGRAR